MSSESQSVGLSMVMLCLTMCFIYLVFFGMHGESIQTELDAIQGNQGVYALASDRGIAHNVSGGDISNNNQIQKQEQEQASINSKPYIIEDSSSLGFKTRPIAAAPQASVGRKFFSVQELFHEEKIDNTGVYAFSGTWQREGHMKSLDAAGLLGQQKYILKNMDNTHFVPLQQVPANFIQQIEAKGGNVVEISDKNTIKENQLFGDMVRYINLPSYQNIKVLQIVFFGSDARFMQVDHDVYEQRKQSLADTFDMRFDW